MPARNPAFVFVTLLALFIAAGALTAGRPAFNPSDVNRLEAAEKNLQVCEEEVARLLDELLDPPGNSRRADPALVNKLRTIAHKVEVVERRVEDTIGPLVERHVENPGPMLGITLATDLLAARSDSFLAQLGEFLEYAPPDITPPEALSVVQSLRDRIRDSIFELGLDYYRAVIPIRFVEFVETASDAIGGDRFKYSVEVTNQVFFSAHLRFYVRKVVTVAGSPFTNLFAVDSAGEEIEDADKRRIHMDYTWPLDWRTSPVIWPLTYPETPDCSFHYPPYDWDTGSFHENRYTAQERAGTYCCNEGEIIVYVNKGTSNGGQYPWYTRIIGMTDDHIATRGTDTEEPKAMFTFAHEMGHYLGLPHTFPSAMHYGRDYDLARITINPTEEQPIETIRRWYEPHENLVNVETGLMAPLSLFWDQVYRPGGTPDGPPHHVFFNSRAEAEAHELYLQPISEWHNGLIFRRGQYCCGETAAYTKLMHVVSAGCLGGEYYFGDCQFPIEYHCTGDPVVRAFSRRATDPDRIVFNVMNYGFAMADGSRTPHDLAEGNFISASQLEQIERVMNPAYDVVTRYYPEMTGMRPQLRSCEECH